MAEKGLDSGRLGIHWCKAANNASSLPSLPCSAYSTYMYGCVGQGVGCARSRVVAERRDRMGGGVGWMGSTKTEQAIEMSGVTIKEWAKIQQLRAWDNERWKNGRSLRTEGLWWVFNEWIEIERKQLWSDTDAFVRKKQRDTYSILTFWQWNAKGENGVWRFEICGVHDEFKDKERFVNWHWHWYWHVFDNVGRRANLLITDVDDSIDVGVATGVGVGGSERENVNVMRVYMYEHSRVRWLYWWA
jgi:hypothetical protein